MATIWIVNEIDADKPPWIFNFGTIIWILEQHIQFKLH